jgi:hypothetical protein
VSVSLINEPLSTRGAGGYLYTLPETVSKGFVFCVMNVEDGDEAND